MRFAFAVIGFALLAPTAAAQQTNATSPGTRVARAVDANVMRAHLEFLADDELLFR